MLWYGTIRYDANSRVNMSYSLDLRGRGFRRPAARQLFMQRARDPNAVPRMARFGRAPHYATTGPAPPPAPVLPARQQHGEVRLPVNLRRNSLSLTLPPPRVPPPAAEPAPAPAQQLYRPSEMRLSINLSRNPLSLTLPPPLPRVPPAPRQFRSFHIIIPPRRSPSDHLPNPLYPTSPQRGRPGAREITSLSSVEAGKRAAAYAAVDAHFGNAPGHVGIGSGSTVFYVVDRIRQLSAERISNTGFVPTGHQSRELLRNAGLRVVRLEDVPGRINVAFDGADEVDGWLNCVKGGGGCLLLEKLVAIRSEVFVVVAGLYTTYLPHT